MDMIIGLAVIAGSLAYVLAIAGSYNMTYNEVAKEMKGKQFIY